MPTSTSTWTEPQRAVTALAMLAWAYLELLRAGQDDRAAQVLAYFQGLFEARKQDVVSMYDPAQQAGVARILSPTVQGTGYLDDPTRAALVASLVTGWAHVEAPAASSTVTTFPADPALAAGWYSDRIRGVASSDSLMWTLARPLLSTAQPDVVAMLNAEVPAFIAGTPVPGPSGSTPAEPGLVTAGPTLPWETSTGTPGVILDPRLTSMPRATAMEPITVTATRTQFPTWGLWAMGIGGAVALGIVAWGVWGKQ